MLTTLALVVVTGPHAGATRQPDEIGGLVAWYAADSIRLRNGQAVRSWRDRSGNEHRLTSFEDGKQPAFRASRLNGHPVVSVREYSEMEVTEPFELGDHTIFLVYRSGKVKRALFSSDLDDQRGLLLRVDGRQDAFQIGGLELFPYTGDGATHEGFTVTALGRQADVLTAYINGVNVSGDGLFGSEVRVGKMFYLAHSHFANADGDGLSIAEMLFYDRYLPVNEAYEVARYLGDKYAIEVVEPPPEPEPPADEPPPPPPSGTLRARLTSTDPANLNGKVVPLRWTGQETVQPPFRHEPGGDGTRLRCTADGTVADLRISISLTSPTAGVDVRVLVLKNGETYLEGEASSGSFGGAERETVTVELAASVTLDEGDHIEVILNREGGEGSVTLADDGATLAAWTE
jgi:hypothetical protein